MTTTQHPARRPLAWRSTELLDTLLDELTDGTHTRTDLLIAAHDIAGRRTIDNTLHELAYFGAIQRIDRHGESSYRLTYLGQCWLDHRTPDTIEHIRSNPK